MPTKTKSSWEVCPPSRIYTITFRTINKGIEKLEKIKKGVHECEAEVHQKEFVATELGHPKEEL